MKQILLATALIILPVTAFSGFQVLTANSTLSSNTADAGLGAFQSFIAIITDVQSIAGGGDLAAAKTRIKDFEIAWDQNEKGLKPMDPTRWGQIDEAADAALTSLRAKTPDSAQVKKTLAALQSVLNDAAKVQK